MQVSEPGVSVAASGAVSSEEVNPQVTLQYFVYKLQHYNTILMQVSMSEESSLTAEFSSVGDSDVNTSLLLPSVHASSDESSRDSDSSDEPEFTYAESVDMFDQWISVQRREVKQMVAVRLTDLLIHEHGYLKTKAAEEAANVIRVNEKTVRRWRSDFYAHKGQLTEDGRGQYERLSILSDETCRKKAAEWVRSNASKKGEPVMTAPDFLMWVNSSLLTNADLPQGYPRQISLATAKRWLHRLGFSPMSHKKGVYFDGHERTDVVDYRRVFLRKLEILQSIHLPPPLCDDGLVSHDIGSTTAQRKLVLICHDESIFHSNEDQGWQWAEPGKLAIKPKGKGRGLMVSDFVDEHCGFLCLSSEERERALQLNSQHPISARVILKYGAELEGYWNSDMFMQQVKKACTIAEFKYPRETHSLVWLFDQSSGHSAYPADALNIHKMNIKPGGKQAVLRDTINPFTGRLQRMVDRQGRPKGIRQVLEERGVSTAGMRGEEMRRILGSHSDFLYEKTKVEQYLEKEKGHRVLFFPKYHCEFNPIERVWAEAKKYTRARCNYSFQQLERTVDPALDAVTVAMIRKFFRKARDFMAAYREGKPCGPELFQAVKSYKSHRRVPVNK